MSLSYYNDTLVVATLQRVGICAFLIHSFIQHIGYGLYVGQMKVIQGLGVTQSK